MMRMGLQLIRVAKQNVKEQQFSRNPIIKLGINALFRLYNSFNTIKRILIDPNYRAILFLQLSNNKNVHQTTPLTFMNRYPEIFAASKDYFNNKKELKILSYGCSTGEEVLTLRQYFPTAHIIGADINKQSLAICKRRTVDEKITFIYSTPSELKKFGPYDAIFCMAVLQRKPHYIAEKGISSLKKIYPFEKFEKQIIELDQLIKLQGLLIVHYTQYSLQDTCVASKYKVLGSYHQNDYSSPVFDKNSELIKNPSPQSTMFIKTDNSI